MKTKRLLLVIIIGIFVIETGIYAMDSLAAKDTPGIQTVLVKKVASTISADGSITAQNQAALHFQIAGKLLTLPFKEGDKVSAGQIIARLDTYALQKQLHLAANAYETEKNSTDQTLENQQAGILEGQQRVSLDTTNKNGYSVITESQVITDTVKRLVNNSLLSQNSAQLNVDLANYATQLATVATPVDGVVTHEDVTIAGVNITPTTTFVVEDPDTAVFRATISENDIDFVSEGAQALISLDGVQDKMRGSVIKIYPAKVPLSNGQQVYQVDIQSDNLKMLAKLDQSGTVLISSNTPQNVMLVPVWTVLGGKSVWVINNNSYELRPVKVGKTHGSDIEVTQGLNPGDQVVINPETISSKKYLLL